MQQDAESELQELQQQLQLDFQRKLAPVIQQVAMPVTKEARLHILPARDATEGMIAVAVAFVTLRTTGSDVRSVAEVEAMLAGGTPTLVEFYSNT